LDTGVARKGQPLPDPYGLSHQTQDRVALTKQTATEQTADFPLSTGCGVSSFQNQPGSPSGGCPPVAAFLARYLHVMGVARVLGAL
jgi:hypothetical protein